MDATIQIPDALRHGGLDAALRGLQALAERDLMDLGRWVPLYESGVQYQREPRGRERWLTPRAVMEKGRGDCEDLAAWRAAELRVTGEDPGAQAVVVRSGDRTWHAVVDRSEGPYPELDLFEDPSAALGMKNPGGMIAPVRFALIPGRDRNYNARIELQGGGIYGAYEDNARCPVRALRGALRKADDSYMGQIPFLQPFLNMLMPATRPPSKVPTGPRQPGALLPPDRDSLEDGVLDLAVQLRRLAKREAGKQLRPRRF